MLLVSFVCVSFTLYRNRSSEVGEYRRILQHYESIAHSQTFVTTIQNKQYMLNWSINSKSIAISTMSQWQNCLFSERYLWIQCGNCDESIECQLKMPANWCMCRPFCSCFVNWQRSQCRQINRLVSSWRPSVYAWSDRTVNENTADEWIRLDFGWHLLALYRPYAYREQSWIVHTFSLRHTLSITTGKISNCRRLKEHITIIRLTDLVWIKPSAYCT